MIQGIALDRRVQNAWSTVVFFLMAALVDPTIAAAQERTNECTSVVNRATITMSRKLLLGISESPTDKTCHFVVSLPPPHSLTDPAVNAWFKFSALDAQNTEGVIKLLSGLAFAVTPKDSGRHLKELEQRIAKNSTASVECLMALFNKSPIQNKAPDGQFSCTVPASGDYALFEVSAGPNLKNTFILPAS